MPTVCAISGVYTVRCEESFESSSRFSTVSRSWLEFVYPRMETVLIADTLYSLKLVRFLLPSSGSLIPAGPLCHGL